MSSNNPLNDYILIDLLRHGACEGGNIFRGSTDVALSDRGWEQMREAVSSKQGWQHIISSPQKRCRLFAEEQAAERQLPITLDEAWREVNFGVWEGQKIKQVWKTNQTTIAQYFSDPGSVTPEGGEPVSEARARLVLAWQALLKDTQHQHLLLVQHGGTIRLLLSHLLDAPLTAINGFEVNYAAMTRIKVYRDTGHAVIVNHHPGFTE